MQKTQSGVKRDFLEILVTISIRVFFRGAAIAVLVIFFDIFESILHHQDSDISAANIFGGFAGATFGDILWVAWLQQLGGIKRMATIFAGLAILIWIGSYFQQLPQDVQQQANISPSWLILLLAALLVSNVFSDLVWNDSARALVMPRIHAFFKKPD